MSGLYYIEIKKYLIDLIEQNKHIPNYKLPSENHLANKFNTSRITIKNAMKQLEESGLIVRYQGRGTFINTDKLNETTMKDLTTCIIVPNISSRFVQDIIDGAVETFDQAGIMCMIYQTHNLQPYEEKILTNLYKYHISGALIYPASGAVYNKSLLELAIKEYPIVSIDRNLHDINLDCVLTDHYKMVYDYTTSLLQNGHKDIVLILPEQFAQSTQLRISGYTDAHINMKTTPSNHNILTVHYDYFAKFNKENEQNLNKIFRDFWEKHPNTDAVISSNNFITTPLIQSIKRLNRKINLTFIDDDHAEIKDLISFEYQTIIQDGFTIGKTAAKLLIEKIQNTSSQTKIIQVPIKTTIE